jgi:hypothetical protein
MTIDEACQMTTDPTLLNALHACRVGHPWNVPGVNHWRRAYFLAAQRPSYETTYLVTDWLWRMANDWDRRS